MKLCNVCGTCDSKRFAKSQNYRCKVCTNKYSQHNYRLNKLKIIQQSKLRNKERIKLAREYVFELLKFSECVDCGESDIVVLEFDHVRGRKKANVSDLIRIASALSTIKEEIDKCDIVCANCHRRRTARRHGGWYRTVQ